MNIKSLITVFTFLLSFIGYSQNVQLSAYSEISIITSGPGNNLYEKFGHTAIRVKDPVLNIDLLYNYGIFDFNDPNFYMNFVKGFMNYKLAKYPFHYALKDANNDQRWVKQQLLNLSDKEKNEFFYFLENNAKPSNANYLYDPFFDNCSTRPKDIIQKIFGKNLIINENAIKTTKSLRTLMNEKIHSNTWGSFGINIALGSRLDKTASVNEHAYLPEFLFKILKNSKIKREQNEVNLIKRTINLLDYKTKIAKADTFNPLTVFTILLLISLFITYKDYKNKRRSKILDFVIFVSTGLVGLLIVFLWFFTNHSTAPNNFNFLWALAPNFFIAFIILKKQLKSWFKNYILVLLILISLIPIVSIIGIQKFTYPLIPIFILLFTRYLFLFNHIQKKEA